MFHRLNLQLSSLWLKWLKWKYNFEFWEKYFFNIQGSISQKVSLTSIQKQPKVKWVRCFCQYIKFIRICLYFEFVALRSTTLQIERFILLEPCYFVFYIKLLFHQVYYCLWTAYFVFIIQGKSKLVWERVYKS